MDENVENTFPAEWWYPERTESDSSSYSLRCFEIPDYTRFPRASLSDHPFFVRLVLTLRDLSQALSALVFLEEEIDWEEDYPLAELRRFQAYETSLVVSYARPFSQSENGVPRLSYRKLGIKLPKITKDIHEDLISKRNKVFAHSDASEIVYAPPFVLRGRREDGSVYTSLGAPRFMEGTFFGQADLARIRVLVDCLHSAVFQLANAMHPFFIDGSYVHDIDDVVSSNTKD